MQNSPDLWTDQEKAQGIVGELKLLKSVVDPVHRLDHARLRSSRGWRTAARVDAETPHWSMRVRRARLYRAASCAIRKAVLDSPSKRARRRAERNAILHTLERFKLIRCTRGTGVTKRK